MKISHLCLAVVAGISCLSSHASAEIYLFTGASGSQLNSTDPSFNPPATIDVTSLWVNQTDGTNPTITSIETFGPTPNSSAFILEMNFSPNAELIVDGPGTFVLNTGGDRRWNNNVASITLSGGATITTPNFNSDDWISRGPTVVNDATLNIADDIFTQDSTITLNTGSVTNVNDDLEANAGGTLNIFGGTHTAGLSANEPQTGNFGSQGASTVNFNGGTVSAIDLRATAGNDERSAGGIINFSGTAEGDFQTANILFPSVEDAANGITPGSFNFDADWTGNLDVESLTSLSAWEAFLTNDGANNAATFDGVTLDAATFNDNFQFSGNQLSLTASAIPEPSSLMLLGVLGMGIATRRRR